MLSSLKNSPSNSLLFGYCDYTDDDRPYYVGIGDIRRVRRPKRNKKHDSVSNKYGQKRVIEVIILNADNAWTQLCSWEGATIALRQTKHDPGNIGCNFTIGGDGVRGFKRVKSEEERHKISESKKRLYADFDNRKKLGEAIHQAKLDTEKYKNHCNAQRKRYSDYKERVKAHEANTQKKRVQQMTLDGKIIAEFSSLSYAIQATGVKNIKLVCLGKRRVAGGYRWKYVQPLEAACQRPLTSESGSTNS